MGFLADVQILAPKINMLHGKVEFVVCPGVFCVEFVMGYWICHVVITEKIRF